MIGFLSKIGSFFVLIFMCSGVCGMDYSIKVKEILRLERAINDQRAVLNDVKNAPDGYSKLGIALLDKGIAMNIEHLTASKKKLIDEVYGGASSKAKL